MAKHNPLPTRSIESPQTWAAVVVLALVTGGALAAWMSPAKVPAPPAISEIPSSRASERRCAECHAEIVEAFHTAPHARTLHQVTEPEIAGRFSGMTFHRDDTGVEYRYELREGKLWVASSAYGREFPIQWVFGSGTHAQTPLMIWGNMDGNNASAEHTVSWYPGHGLGVSLGAEKSRATEGITCLGRPLGPAETAQCFGCHSNAVPEVNGEIRFDALEPNIGCARCHWNALAHIAEVDRGEDARTIERFSRLSPLESVERCGECHRRASEMEGAGITRENASLVRLAPVGFVQSPCFTQQGRIQLDDGSTARMDCTTCHDPHRPARSDWQHYAQVCLNCHDATRHRAAHCPVATRQENCIECHMPKVELNPQLRFTDHWIRVRESPVPHASRRP